MNRKTSLLLVVLMGLTLSACGGKKVAQEQAPTTPSAPPVANNNGDEANAWGTGLSKRELSDLGITQDPLNYNVVYFAYNSSAVDRRSDIIISAHARNLGKRGGGRVVLEGHADERGTRDYNLALGERRANQVANLMRAVGAGNSSMQAISYGEERPVNEAHNEEAWAQNRRVKISY